MNTNDVSVITQGVQAAGFDLSGAQIAVIAAVGHYVLIQGKSFVAWWNDAGGLAGIRQKFNYGNKPPIDSAPIATIQPPAASANTQQPK